MPVGIQITLSQVTELFSGMLYEMLSGWPVELSMAVLVMFNSAVPVDISPVVEAD